MKAKRYDVAKHAAQGAAALKGRFTNEEDYNRYMSIKAHAGWKKRKARKRV